MPVNKPTAAELRALLDYDPATGVLRWKVPMRYGLIPAGAIAGTVTGAGTTLKRRVKVFGRVMFSHRVIWAIVHGEWPDGEIDHINCDPLDNRLVNLREATHQQNTFNQRGKGAVLKGVRKNPRGGSYIATIRAGTVRYLGSFNTPEEAHAAYCAAAKELHGEFARLK